MANNMDALARLKGQVNNFKKKDITIEKTKSESLIEIKKENISEYYDLNFVEDKKINTFLVEKTLELHSIQTNASVDIGKIFYEAHEKFAGKNQYDGVYTKWLNKIGFNKMTALRHKKRYELFSWSHDVTSKFFLASLPVKTIEKLYSHQERNQIMSLIEEGNIKTNVQLMEMLDVKNASPNQKNHFKLEIDDIKNGYNDIKTGIERIDLEKIKSEELEVFYKDIEKVKKILDKWNS
jgi:hypothetical protein